MIAALMCGGSGIRMGADVEKPLVTIAGTCLAARVVNALYESRKFDRIVAAVTARTPATKAFLETRGLEIIETPGIGYSQDLSFLLGRLSPSRVFVISADMPLVSAQIVDEIASTPQTKPVLSFILTKKFVEGIGITPSVTFNHDGVEYCQSGISIFETSRHSESELDEQYVVIDRLEVAVNVNRKKDLELAEKLLIQRV